MYKVYVINSFKTILNTLSRDEQEKVNKIFLQLKENPYVGDQLRYRFFREKRIKEKRVYYLIYDYIKIVLMVGISDKKAQQSTINQIVRYFKEYRKYAENLSKED